METKYKMTDETKEYYYGLTLHRIQALRDFSNVHTGDLGGWIEREENLSQEGDCWIYNNANVFDSASIFGNAKVFGNAIVYYDAIICGDAIVFGCAHIGKSAYINNSFSMLAIQNIGSRRGTTTFYFTENKDIMVDCGCFNGTIEEFNHAVNTTHKDNPRYLKEYIGAIEYAKSVLSIKE